MAFIFMFLSFYEVISHTEPEWRFEPRSAGYKATTLPFELSSIEFESDTIVNKKI